MLDTGLLLCTKYLKVFWNDVCVDMGCFSAAAEILVFAIASRQTLDVIQIKVLLRASRGYIV